MKELNDRFGAMPNDFALSAEGDELKKQAKNIISLRKQILNLERFADLETNMPLANWAKKKGIYFSEKVLKDVGHYSPMADQIDDYAVYMEEQHDKLEESYDAKERVAINAEGDDEYEDDEWREARGDRKARAAARKAKRAAAKAEREAARAERKKTREAAKAAREAKREAAKAEREAARAAKKAEIEELGRRAARKKRLEEAAAKRKADRDARKAARDAAKKAKDALKDAYKAGDISKDDYKTGKKDIKDTKKDELRDHAGFLRRAALLAKKLALAPVRGAFQTLLRMNFWGFATKMKEEKDKDSEKWKELIKAWVYKFGGSESSFSKSVELAYRRKPFLIKLRKKSKRADGGYVIEIIPEYYWGAEPISDAAIVSLIGLATAAISTVAGIIGKPKDVDDDSVLPPPTDDPLDTSSLPPLDLPDGSTATTNLDGTVTITAPDGTETVVDPGGNVVSVTDPEGNIISGGGIEGFFAKNKYYFAGGLVVTAIGFVLMKMLGGKGKNK